MGEIIRIDLGMDEPSVLDNKRLSDILEQVDTIFKEEWYDVFQSTIWWWVTIDIVKPILPAFSPYAFWSKDDGF